MKMRIIIEREDGTKAEISTPENGYVDEVLKLITIALQVEGYEYVKELRYDAEEEIRQLEGEIRALNRLIDDLEGTNIQD